MYVYINYISFLKFTFLEIRIVLYFKKNAICLKSYFITRIKESESFIEYVYVYIMYILIVIITILIGKIESIYKSIWKYKYFCNVFKYKYLWEKFKVFKYQ